MLVGKSGHGKSSTGNSLCANKTLFPKNAGTASFTKFCRTGYRTFEGKELIIYDTPGLFDTEHENNVFKAQISHAIQMASPGPHTFLILFKIGTRFTDEEKKTIEVIQEIFGQGADQFCILAFTGEDNLINDGDKIEDYLKNADSGLKQLLERCQNRYITINNRLMQQEEIDKTVKKLLEIIETMLVKNQVRYYTTAQFQKAEQELQEREKQRIETELQKKEAEEKALREKIHEEFRERERRLEQEKAELDKFMTDLRKESRNAAENQNRSSLLEAGLKIIPSTVEAAAPVFIAAFGKNSTTHDQKKKDSAPANGVQPPLVSQQPAASNEDVKPAASEKPAAQNKQETAKKPIIMAGTPGLFSALEGIVKLK